VNLVAELLWAADEGRVSIRIDAACGQAILADAFTSAFTRT